MYSYPGLYSATFLEGHLLWSVRGQIAISLQGPEPVLRVHCQARCTVTYYLVRVHCQRVTIKSSLSDSDSLQFAVTVSGKIQLLGCTVRQGTLSVFAVRQGTLSEFAVRQGSLSVFAVRQGTLSVFAVRQGALSGFAVKQSSLSVFAVRQGEMSVFAVRQGALSGFAVKQSSLSVFAVKQGSLSVFCVRQVDHCMAGFIVSFHCQAF